MAELSAWGIIQQIVLGHTFVIKLTTNAGLITSGLVPLNVLALFPLTFLVNPRQVFFY